VFQLESSGIRDLLQRMRPDHFRDIIATNALYRPGPLQGGMVDDYILVKHGKRKPEYKHPLMREVLEETHGVMVYQEQVMRLLNLLGGIELADAYSCIKAISKKKLDLIAKYREQFIAGAHRRGMSKREAGEVFALIEKFAGYGFNKSHSTAYALIAYMTAYLKAHYPLQFMAALLSSDIPNRNFKKKDPLVEHLEDCQRMQIQVMPPDVNRCGPEFTVADGKIFFGLAAVKGCGGAAATAIAAERAAHGPYRSLFDFCERLDPSVVNRTAIENLIKAGAMDGLGGHRGQLFAALDRAMQVGAARAADRRRGQRNLFEAVAGEEVQNADTGLPPAHDWDQRERLAHEKEVLGYYLSGHPLAEHAKKLASYCSHTIQQALQLKARTDVMLGGMITEVKYGHSKKPGDLGRYAVFELEDMSDTIRCLLWPEAFAKYGELLRPEAIVVLRGAIERRIDSEETNLIVQEVIPFDNLAVRSASRVIISLHERQHGAAKLELLHELLRNHPGSCELELMLYLADGLCVACRCDGFRVAPTPEMQSQVEELLGPGNCNMVFASSVVGVPLVIRRNGRQKR
jgi:DNA polymerase-3 subunit alpha